MKIRSAESATNRRQKRVVRTRRRLKDAALGVFSEKSVDAATIEEITAKADLGKGTLYEYFEDKEEIVVTLIEEAVEHLIDRIRACDPAPASIEDMLEHLLNVHYEFSINAREEFLLLFQGKLLAKLESDAADDLEEPYLRYLRGIEEQVSTYLSPRIAPLKVRRLACAVAGSVFGFFSFAMIGMSAEEIETSIAPLRRVFVGSLVTFLGR